jgi:hypothetical protein
MKHTITSKSSLSLLALATAATLTSNAHAGAPAKPVAAPAKDSSTLLAGSFLEKMTGSVDVGYDSGYYFRGLWFSNNNVWEGLTLNLPVTDQLSLTFGGIYTSSTNTRVVDATGSTMLKYSELDLIAGASYDAGFAKFGLVYTYYNFYDTFSGSTAAGSFGNNDRDSRITTSSDLGFTISKSIGPVNLNAGYWYDFRIGGQYLESSADYPIEVTSHFSVVPSVSVGYGLDYYSFAGNLPATATSAPGKRDGFTAVRPALSFPIKVTETATFTPYAAMNLSGSARYNPMTASNTVEGRNDFYFGGKMSVSF